jgi:HSP20 family protein
MHEQAKQQQIPVKVYRTDDRLMIAAPMAGLEPENLLVEVTDDGRLILHGDQRALLKEIKELLIDEWSVGAYGNGVLMVALPISEQTFPARLTLERVTPTHGERRGNAGSLATCVETQNRV